MSPREVSRSGFSSCDVGCELEEPFVNTQGNLSMSDPKSQTPEEETATTEFLSLNENQTSNYYYFCSISLFAYLQLGLICYNV